jgi:hypothetical protein
MLKKYFVILEKRVFLFTLKIFIKKLINEDLFLNRKNYKKIKIEITKYEKRN